MGKPIPPCKDCKSRKIGCKTEGACPLWDKYQKDKLDFVKLCAKERFKYKDIDNYHYEAVRKAMRA